MVHIYNIYAAIERNKFESVLMRCVNIEPITQNELRKTKNTYCILTHISYIDTYIWNL